jgi:hypothetical protein
VKPEGRSRRQVHQPISSHFASAAAFIAPTALESHGTRVAEWLLHEPTRRVVMKLGILSCVGVLFLSSVAMADVRVDLNGGETKLDACGGTIEATAQGGSPNVNLVLRNVKSCSNFVIKNTKRQYKVPGADGDRAGSFSISAGKLQNGWNKVRLTLRSNSGKTADDIAIWIQVAR